MTIKRDDLSLSRLELLVLARYSVSRPPTLAAVYKDVIVIALSTETTVRAKEQTANALSKLRNLALLIPKMPERRPKKPPATPPPLQLTTAGEHVLRAALSLARTPTWAEIRDAHLPALGLGLRPGSSEAATALSSLTALVLEMLHAQHGTPRAPTVDAACDAIITASLELPPGPISSLKQLRAQVLARKIKASVNGTALEIAKRGAASIVRMSEVDKRSLTKGLRNRWLAEQTGHSLEQLPSQASTSNIAAPPLPSTPPRVPFPPKPLLEVVREIIPQVGSDGRFGPEKVFVSAIWRNLERDRRVNGDFSFDRFKRWLLTANREGHLILARADLVGAMDAKLVADSEIRDQGATFHFVLDRRPVTPGTDRKSHAR